MKLKDYQKQAIIKRAKKYIKTLPLYKSQPSIINDKSIQDIFIAGYLCRKRQRYED